MKTVVVTGASSGIGLAVCKSLLASGYRVIGIGRDREKCAALQAELGEGISYLIADLLHQSEVWRAAEEIAAELESNHGGRLYALINNAGCTRSWYMTTQEGFEHQFALNHLAGFLLTHRLLPYLIAGQGRVLMTSSNSHKMMKMRWNDLMFQRGYHQLLAYKQSKLCNMLFARGLNDRFQEMGIRAYGIDPGLVNTEIGLKDTGGMGRWVWSMRMKQGISPEASAKTYLWLLEQEEPPQGLYYASCHPARCSGQVNRQHADRLWAVSEELCGIAFGKEHAS